MPLLPFFQCLLMSNFSMLMSDYLADGWQAKFDENGNVSLLIQ